MTTSPHSPSPATSTVAVRPSLLLALIGAVALPPLAIDMYLPSLPEISTSLAAPVGIAQLTLTLFLLMLGVGQLVGGPVTDAVGRRRPLLLGLALFALGSVIAALAPSIEVLLAARIAQGAGGALAVVVANSSVRDLASGDGATKLYALMMGAVGVAPVIAPTIGGFVDAAWGWRAVFWVLSGAGLVLMGLALFVLPETLSPQRRAPLRLGAAFTVYRSLLRTPRFTVPSLALIMLLALLFAYIGGASYVYQQDFGLSARSFGLAFGATGVAMMLANLAVNRLSARVSTRALALTGAVFATAGGIAAVALALTDVPFPVFLSAIIVMAIGLGLAEPALMGQAMSAVESGAGQAAALLGAAQFLLGAVSTVVAGILAAQGPLPWALLLTVLAAAALALTLVPVRSRTMSVAA